MTFGARLVACFWAASLWACPRPPEPVDGSPDTPDLPCARLAARATTGSSLDGGEERCYELPSRDGDLVRAVVEQQGIDVVLELLTADGERSMTVDSPTGSTGREELWWIVRGEIPARLLVRAPSAGAGAYALRFESRPATESDRRRAFAEGLFYRAEGLRWQGGAAALYQAVEGHQDALTAFRTLAIEGRIADTLERLGRLHLDLSDPAAAITAYEEALGLYRRLGRPASTIAVLNGLGKAWRQRGEPRRSLAMYRQVLELGLPIPDEGEAVALLNMGRTLIALGELEEAGLAFEAALALFRDLEDPRRGVVLSNLGILHAKVGSFELAASLFEEALQIFEERGDLSQAAITASALGRAYGELGRLAEGRVLLERSVQALHAAGNAREAAIALGHLAWILGREGQPSAALEMSSRALAGFRALGDLPSVAVTLANVARAKQELGQHQAAVADYREALRLLDQAGDLYNQVTAWWGLAVADLASSPDDGATWHRARQALEKALVLLEQLREEPLGSSERQALFATRHGCFELYVEVLMELDRRGEKLARRAYAVSEQARARDLLDLLTLPEKVLKRSPVGDDEAAYSAVRQLLRHDHRPPPTADVERPRAGPRSLAEIQSRLAEDEILLQFQLGTERSYLWRITASSFATFELPAGRVLATAARRLHRLGAAANQVLARTQARQAASELGELLLAPVASQLDRRKLLVVADGALHRVPFAALVVPGEDDPLIASHTVELLPSASLLGELRRPRARSAASTLAILADPVFAVDDPRLSPPPVSPPKAPPGAPPGGLDLWPRLPFARQEAEAVLAWVAEPQRLAAFDFAADRELVLSGRLRPYRVVHFATHGVFDPEHPEASGIVLSSVDASAQPKHGLLSMRDIMGLELTADLVVLSACSTALGKDVPGEGVIGLARAFVIAGARQVLVSLWRLDDQATSELMTGFYRQYFAEGRSAAESLRQAQLDLSRQGAFAALYFWAGFILYGG